MEHRLASRTPLRVHVRLYHRDECLGDFTTRDANDSGLFVETGDLDVHLDEVVRVCFMSDDDLDAARTMKALVVHHSEAGTGLMFYDDSEVSRGARRALLDAASRHG